MSLSRLGAEAAMETAAEATLAMPVGAMLGMRLDYGRRSECRSEDADLAEETPLCCRIA